MILVTGGCGYIGSHVVKALSEAGNQVVVGVDNLSSGRQKALLHNESLAVGDITDVNFLREVFRKYQIETVMHFAALVNAAESNRKNKEYYDVNAAGSENVWQEAVRGGARHLMFASSAAVYGNSVEGSVDESHPLKPSNVYGKSKLDAEQSLRAAAENTASYAIFRFFNVAGSEPTGQLRQSKKSNAIMQRLFAVAAGKDKEVILSGTDYATADGTVVRDFVHVEDIASAHLKALEYLRGGGVSFTCNLGSGVPVSMFELIKVVEEVTGKHIQVKKASRIPGDIAYSLADIRLAKNVLGWHPTHTLRDMVESGWKAYGKGD